MKQMMLKGVALMVGSLFSMMTMNAQQKIGKQQDRIGQLAVKVVGNQSREYVFTDKAAGFWYGQTGQDNHQDWFAGWNVRTKRLFADYQLFADGHLQSRSKAITKVLPTGLERDFPAFHETFMLYDQYKALYVGLDRIKAEKVGIRLLGDNLDGKELLEATKDREFPVLRMRLKDAEGDLYVRAMNGSAPLAWEENILTSDATCGGFLITYGPERDALELSASLARESKAKLEERQARMNALLADNGIRTGTDLDRALPWLELMADALVTEQHGGWGIYAGLPWFTDFWGRDLFISMPGIVLCTGQFGTAKTILQSFAKFMDMDPASATYGRVPNRLNLEGILYNTTDGTPRFVMQALEYVRYTGDVKFLRSIWKNIRTATEAAIANYCDDKAYLRHADADTWMDAKRQGVRPCSPRGDRAVDIQALWYGQLTSAAEIAQLLGHRKDAREWTALAARLRKNFQQDFVDPETGLLYDHLNADGTPDLQLRPNTIYAHGLIDDPEVRRKDTRNMWEHLVYPWGTGSLDQMDDQFHPYHEQWHRYHKDDAYHNGTVWLWQNGMAMQRMIEQGQRDVAWKLFENMNRQAMEEGCVGSLSECADAWCRPGQTWSRRTGTFLQAWSNAEQIRVWNECFLGVRPDLLHERIVLEPQLPSRIVNMEQQIRLGDGHLEFRMARAMDVAADYAYVMSYRWMASTSVTLVIKLNQFEDFEVRLRPMQSVQLNVSGDRLEVSTPDDDPFTVPADASKIEEQAVRKAFFKNVRFAEPCYRENLKSMSRYFDPPLDYSSVE